MKTTTVEAVLARQWDWETKALGESKTGYQVFLRTVRHCAYPVLRQSLQEP